MTKEIELAYWINERYQMRLRHDSELPSNKTEGGLNLPSWRYGWSDDPIMGTTRWCNVHREDDRVTKFMRNAWKMPDGGHPVWWWVLGRMINYGPTLMGLLTHDGKTRAPVSLADISYELKRRRGTGAKVFTSAYTISTCGKFMDKIDYVVDWVVKSVQTYPFDEFTTLAHAFKDMTCIDGLGSFLAGQVLADLKNTAGHPLQQAPDWWTWACPGPGSLRGLEAFYGTRVGAREFASALENVGMLTLPLLDKAIPRISAQDWQNCMCEFSKYMKLKEGRGHARNKYDASGR